MQTEMLSNARLEKTLDEEIALVETFPEKVR